MSKNVISAGMNKICMSAWDFWSLLHVRKKGSDLQRGKSLQKLAQLTPRQLRKCKAARDHLSDYARQLDQSDKRLKEAFAAMMRFEYDTPRTETAILDIGKLQTFLQMNWMILALDWTWMLRLSLPHLQGAQTYQCSRRKAFLCMQGFFQKHEISHCQDFWSPEMASRNAVSPSTSVACYSWWLIE